MTVELKVTGAESFARLSKALKQAGDKELKKELADGIKRATKPLSEAAQRNAASTLPSRGGLGRRVSKTQMKTSKRGSGRNPGIRITAKPNAVADPLRADRGRIRHPVYGRAPWVLQNVKPGWFSKPMEDGSPAVREELVKVVDTVIEKVVRAL